MQIVSTQKAKSEIKKILKQLRKQFKELNPGIIYKNNIDAIIKYKNHIWQYNYDGLECKHEIHIYDNDGELVLHDKNGYERLLLIELYCDKNYRVKRDLILSGK